MKAKELLIPALAMLLLSGWTAFMGVQPVRASGIEKNSMVRVGATMNFQLNSTAIMADTPPESAVWTADQLCGKRVLWLGDSITQAGTYVTDVQYVLDHHFPMRSIDFVSIGLASETTSGLSEKDHPFPRPDVHERLQRALDKVKPEVVIACYGMNDGIYHPQSPERMKAFQDGIGTLIAAVKAKGAKLILLTPPPFDPLPVKSTLPADAPDFSFMKPYVAYDDVLSDYAKWELSLTDPDVYVVDLHTPLKDYLTLRRKTDPQFSYSDDGIHPNDVGHLLMARTILQALGLPAPNIGLDAQLNNFKADPLYKLVAQQRQTRSDGWLDYVGYTRDKTVHASSVDKAEAKVADLQKQIDPLRPPIRVACVGDSITFGDGVWDRDKNSYPAVLSSWLGDRYDVANFGHNGATLLKKGDNPYWNLGELQGAQDDKPDIVIIALGTNDSKHPTDTLKGAPDNWSKKADYIPDYEALIAIFHKVNPAVKVYVCAPPPTYPGQWGINDTTIREEIRPMVRQVAKDTGAKVVDLYAALSDKPKLFPDTVHPNNEGARILAATVYHELTGKDAPE